MMAVRNFTVILFSLFLMQCKTKRNRQNERTLAIPSTQTQPGKLLIGKWVYNNTIWYTAELVLRADGRFMFHDRSCYGQRLSQGEWINKNGVVTLMGTDAGKIKGLADASGSMKRDHGIRGRKDAALPGPNDTVWIYINKVQLQLRNDTLYAASPEKLTEDAKFYRAKGGR